MRPITSNKDFIALRVQSREEMERRLNESNAVLQATAMMIGSKGILVTRHSPWDFTIELHESVPYGITREQQS